jgi:hypothetical protein
MKPENETEPFTPLQDLALIGDRRTCALLDKQGNIVWYCPKRFDNPSLFAHLLDPEKGGSWILDIKGMTFDKREYLEDSALLQTYFKGEKGELVLEDFMPLNGRFYGLCRSLSPAPLPYSMQINPRPNYSRQFPALEQKGEKHAILEYDFHLYTSHPLSVERESISCQVPAGEKAWFIFAEKALEKPEEMLKEVREFTLKNWRELAGHITYKGPYEEEARKSLRLLRMLTYAPGMAANLCCESTARHAMEYGYDVTMIKDAMGAASLPEYEAAVHLNLPLVSNAVITTEEFLKALDVSTPVTTIDVREGDTVKGSDNGDIGMVKEVVRPGANTEGYILVPRGLIFKTETYIPLDAVAMRSGEDVFINIPKLVVSEMPWKEAPTTKDWAAKQAPRAGEVDKLYRSKNASVLKDRSL